ncbi:hypothetical protein ECE50_025170 [Chitinophaga sp. Mgbs1]|uniref:Uncharacterized protein n=1 Tax=Chitinophaga solisilvae TaxID=1233460 RepID=A0A433WB79_9BACT|nr:hypothetical protein [Chitinophaga solisilvae]
MDKISALIDRLQELKNSGADLQTISYYVQLLQAEVLHARNRQHQQEVQERQSQIAVIMPMQAPVTTIAPQTTTIPAEKPEPAPVATPAPPAAAAPQPAAPEPVAPPSPAPVQHITPPTPPPPAPEKEKPKAPAPATLFDQPEHIPAPPNGQATATPEINGIRKDLNELVGKTHSNGTSLNDKLRQQQLEVAQKLGEMPVKDLRSAIGINDKYQFIQELFRGDTDLYERSVKTINECSSMQEADYWIQREIKIIQGWQDDHHLVKHFYSLLRKRFS